MAWRDYQAKPQFLCISFAHILRHADRAVNSPYQSLGQPENSQQTGVQKAEDSKQGWLTYGGRRRYYHFEGRPSMSDVFEKRVRAAAVAGWWTLLVDVGFLLIQWIAYRLAMSAHPAWLLSLWWGPDITWSSVQTMWFWGLAIMKICILPLALATLWLTLWARQLRKRADA